MSQEESELRRSEESVGEKTLRFVSTASLTAVNDSGWEISPPEDHGSLYFRHDPLSLAPREGASQHLEPFHPGAITDHLFGIMITAIYKDFLVISTGRCCFSSVVH
jgi:hypothetical protein